MIPGLGIALGGGAARGWAHIGVLKALIDAGLAPEIVAGTSIGAVAGGCYVADKLPELEEFSCSLTRRRVFGYLDFNLAGSGLITGKRLCDQLDGHLENYRIEDLDKRYTAVATEIGTGNEIWLSKGLLVNAMRASYALPGIFRPVDIGGRWLMDGALVNPIPVSVCRALGARIVIAVNLNNDVYAKGGIIPNQSAIGPVDLPESESKGQEKNGRAAVHLLHRQFFGRGDNNAPGISTVMVDAFNITQDRIARARLAGDPPDLSINPSLRGIGLFDFHHAKQAIQAGYDATEKIAADLEHTINVIAA